MTDKRDHTIYILPNGGVLKHVYDMSPKDKQRYRERAIQATLAKVQKDMEIISCFDILFSWFEPVKSMSIFLKNNQNSEIRKARCNLRSE